MYRFPSFRRLTEADPVRQVSITYGADIYEVFAEDFGDGVNTDIQNRLPGPIKDENDRFRLGWRLKQGLKRGLCLP